MTALETLRGMKRGSAADVAKASGLALEVVYMDLVAARAAGLVSLWQDAAGSRRPRFTWVAL